MNRLECDSIDNNRRRSKEACYNNRVGNLEPNGILPVLLLLLPLRKSWNLVHVVAIVIGSDHEVQLHLFLNKLLTWISRLETPIVFPLTVDLS